MTGDTADEASATSEFQLMKAISGVLSTSHQLSRNTLVDRFGMGVTW
jgi:hypothetical protein